MNGLGIFRRHLPLIGIVALLTVAAGAWLVARRAPRYQASALIRLTSDPTLRELETLTGRAVGAGAVERAGLRVFAGSTGAPAGFVDRVSVALPIEESGTLELEFDANGVAYGTAADRRTAPYGAPVVLDGVRFVVPSEPPEAAAIVHVVARDRAVDYVLENLVAIPDPSTGGIQVLFTSTEPGVAVRAANAIAAEFQAVKAEAAREGMGSRRAALEGRLRATDSLLLAAESGLARLRGREEEARIEALRQADLGEYERVVDRIARARGSGEEVDLAPLLTIPGFAGGPVTGRLYSQWVTHRAARRGLLSGPAARPPGHPDVQRLNTLIASTAAEIVEASRAHVASLRREPPVSDALSEESGTEIGELPAGVTEIELITTLIELQSTAARLRSEVQEARIVEAVEAGPVEVVQSSTRALPLPTQDWITLLLALVVGLALGGAAALGRERLDEWRLIRERDRSLEAEPPVPVLAVIPRVTRSLTETVAGGELEAYRSLKANLLASRWGLKTLVVTSAHPGEGKTTTSTNLAATYARQGMKVVLIECDLRRPSLGRYFGISREVDLMDVLFENHDWRKAIQLTNIPGLYVILGEKSFPRAGESLGGAEMKRLLAEISTEYDIVILDTSPLLVAEDATVLGPIVDGVLLVVRSARTDRRTVAEVVEKLSRAGASVLGMVENDPDRVPGSASAT